MIKRAAAGIGALVVAGGLPLVVGTPAQASTFHCQEYLRSRDYKVGPVLTDICRDAEDSWFGYATCPNRMLAAGVKPGVGQDACDYARH